MTYDNEEIISFVNKLENETKIFNHCIKNIGIRGEGIDPFELSRFTDYLEIAQIDDLEKLEKEIINNADLIKKYLVEYYKRVDAQIIVASTLFAYEMAIIILHIGKFSIEKLAAMKDDQHQSLWTDENPKYAIEAALFTIEKNLSDRIT